MRITPEQVVEAYKATGLKPMQGDYFPEQGCACGIGCMSRTVVGLLPEEDFDPISIMEDAFNVSHNYVVGFTRGFDNLDNKEIYGNDMKDGYADGQAAWKAVVEVGLVEGGAVDEAL
ncbi:hypothetical protein [Alicyclobacillus dauci]|uniref:Uncharacterized protein n=1 Tax=Alicyclobacillus dauci TaxID=1475485 RepID=A0ABY6YWU9_9BACL|nr:hypothetical protein [Alicyclobacillus dauci]WAH35007.1 hypothetical protein NZD86_11765 [Alicyclobacillus dauci]